MSINFRLSYLQSVNNYVDLFLATGMQGIVDNDIALKYSTLDVTIPVTTENIQTISITPTNKQVQSPVEMYLLNGDQNAQDAYGTISQFQVTENSLILTRLYSLPKTEIQVRLLFKEGGA